MPRAPNTKPTSIYWLIDIRPETVASGWSSGKPFYCGKTVSSAARRLQSHVYTARQWPKRKLSLALQDVGCGFAMRIMEVVPHETDWCERERHWIKMLRHLNPDCANVSDGGQGPPGYVPTAEHRAKLRVTSTGRKHSEAALAKMRQPRRPKLWVFSPEHRAKLSRANKTSPKAIAQRAELQASLKGREFSAEHRANMSAARKKSAKVAVTFAKLQAANKGRKISSKHADALHEGRRRRAQERRALRTGATGRKG